jgi:hypothetical protein
MMMTSDIALKVDPEYRKVCEKFLADFDAFTQAFSKAWYKLTHRDMGPKFRYLGPEATIEDGLLWQDPLPERDYELVGEAEIAVLKQAIMATRLPISDLAFTALSAAATYRDSDKRWRQRRSPRARSSKGLGGQPPGGARDRETPQHHVRLQHEAGLRQEDLAGRPNRAGGLRRGGEGGQRCRR